LGLVRFYHTYSGATVYCTLLHYCYVTLQAEEE